MLEEVVKWDPIVSGTNTGALSEKAVAGLAMNSESMLKASHEGGDCFHSSGWDPIVSLSQTENYGTASMVAHGMFAGPSYPIASYPNAVEMVPRLGGGNFSEMVSPFDVPGYGQNFAGICPERYASNKNVAIGKACTGLIPPQEYCQIPNERTLVASPNGKRKLLPDPSSLLDPSKTAEADLDRDLSGETSEPRDSEEKKQRIDQQNSGPDQFTKQTGNKQVRDTSQCGEAPKDNYIHVRARRGQATNSHSLAERVRREKISQRMRLLQELVPGCNKIIGKAVMLDEIINYVQSLQQQVEFLSMKLATVNPELNFDIDGILSKDILHLRGRGAPILGFNPGSSSSPNPYAPTIHQEALTGYVEGEMQGLFHMGYHSNPTVANLGPSGNQTNKHILLVPPATHFP